MLKLASKHEHDHAAHQQQESLIGCFDTTSDSAVEVQQVVPGDHEPSKPSSFSHADASTPKVKRRVWGRVEFAHTGWRPQYEVENPPNMHDHVWTPPRGSSSGEKNTVVCSSFRHFPRKNKCHEAVASAIAVGTTEPGHGITDDS